VKSAYYLLALLVVGLAVLALVFRAAPTRPTRVPAGPRQTVFVDVAALAELHPSFAALTQMRALAAVSRNPREIVNVSACSPEAAFHDPVRPPELTRPEIEAELTQSAMSAFSRLETSQRQALQARLRAVRATMSESGKPELAAKIRQIERTAELKLRSLAAQLGEMRLSATIRADVLAALVSGLDSILPRDLEEDQRDPNGVLAEQRARLKATQLELQRIDRTLSSEMSAIRAEAQEKINKLKADAAADVSARLSARESAERSKIETGIAAARNEVLTEMGVPAGIAGFERLQTEKPARTRSTPLVAIRPSGSGAAKTRPGVSAAVASAAASLEARVVRDTVRAIRQIASERGLRVTFVRSPGVPDATGSFGALLRNGAVWEPVLARSGG